MKKVCMVLIVVICIFSLCSCSNKTELICDNEGCQNKVTVEYKSSEKKPKDEEWVVFCRECEKEELAY